MKKLIVFCAFVFCASALCAEDMKLVTLLSQPVGSFSQVETLSNTPANIYHLNFCNKSVSAGTITVRQAAGVTYPVDILNLLVKSGATLGGNVSKYDLTGGSAPQMQLTNGADVTGGKLTTTGSANPTHVLVSTCNSSADACDTGDATATLAPSSLTTNVASFNKMEIANVATLDKTASDTGATASSLGWSRITTGACSGKTTAECNAYLLHGN